LWLSWKICTPGYISSIRIATDMAPPMDTRHDREDQVHRADVLVVRRIDVAPPASRVVVRMIVVSVIARTLIGMSGRCSSGHFQIL